MIQPARDALVVWIHSHDLLGDSIRITYSNETANVLNVACTK